MSFVYVLAGIFIFGFLVAIHELGHFLAARLCGVRVNEFSIGMGPLLWRRETGETRYSLRLLPIGGFCALEGEDGDTGDERSFTRQGFWKKLVILAAGSFMNLLAGIAVIACIFATASGFYVDQVAGFSEGFPLEGEDGLMEGDIFYKIDGWRTYLRGDASLFLQFNDGKGVDMEVIRDGEKVVLKDLPLYRRTYDGQEGRFGLMVGAARVPATFFNTVKFIGYQTLDFVQQVWFSLIQLFRGSVGLSEVSGPVAMTVSPSGIWVTSPGRTVMLGWPFTRSVTIRAKPWRSTASAPPASTRVASAQERIKEPSRRSSSFKRPTAFSSWSLRSELEQHSSAK